MAKQIEFVHLEAEDAGFSFGLGLEYSYQKAEEIILQRAADGWDYRGWLPADTRSTGELLSISLIFRKEE